MDARTPEGKHGLKEKSKDDFLLEDDLEDDMEEEEGGSGGFFDEEKKKGVGALPGKRGGGASLPSCQVENCGTDLTDAKRYHRRHKVCEVHAKASAVMVAGLRQRFCQQCSRELSTCKCYFPWNYFNVYMAPNYKKDQWNFEHIRSKSDWISNETGEKCVEIHIFPAQLPSFTEEKRG